MTTARDERALLQPISLGDLVLDAETEIRGQHPVQRDELLKLLRSLDIPRRPGHVRDIVGRVDLVNQREVIPVPDLVEHAPDQVLVVLIHTSFSAVR